ncbi:MAG: diguanylate cyclase [Thermodesulfobacteriota bacterium]
MEKSSLLIVDDDMAIREAMKEYFTLADFNTSTAADAYETLDFLKNNPGIDVVITDIMMPGMNGLELTDRIKSAYDTDVIVITGYTENYSYEEAIKKGASDIVFKPVRFEELLLRVKRVLRERKLTHERNDMVEKLKKLAVTDGLTKLFNSRKFYEQLETEIERFNRYKHPLSLIMLDIDHFKEFNDTFGHLEGDKVLYKVGEIINSSLRAMDTAYRYGGEEFTVILPETRADEAEVVASRIKESLEDEIFIPQVNEKITVTASFGITEYLPPENIHSFVNRVDQALYSSKDEGRNKITVMLANSQ